MVETVQLKAPLIEITEEMQHIIPNRRPEMPVEGRPKTVRPRASMNIHSEESMSNFCHGEGVRHVVCVDCKMRIKIMEVEVPGSLTGSTQKV